MGAKVISWINLKGGVGKTTACIGVAHALAAKFKHRVLVIDLDPQTNATTMLIGENRWESINSIGRTVEWLFRDAKLEMSERTFNIHNVIQRNVGDIRNCTTIDLLPSTLNLIDIQDDMLNIHRGRFHSITPVDILERALVGVKDLYDYILIDCPPNLGIITLNGIRMSDWYVIPTIPDVLSTYGISQIISRIELFAKEIDKPVRPLGILFNKVRSGNRWHKEAMRRVARNCDVPVFDTYIRESREGAMAAEFLEVDGSIDYKTFQQKWGYFNEVFGNRDDEKKHPFLCLVTEMKRRMGVSEGKNSMV
ncbi:MAG: ParA family protein [Bacilli bacterium]